MLILYICQFVNPTQLTYNHPLFISIVFCYVQNTPSTRLMKVISAFVSVDISSEKPTPKSSALSTGPQPPILLHDLGLRRHSPTAAEAFSSLDKKPDLLICDIAFLHSPPGGLAIWQFDRSAPHRYYHKWDESEKGCIVVRW